MKAISNLILFILTGNLIFVAGVYIGARDGLNIPIYYGYIFGTLLATLILAQVITLIKKRWAQ